MIINDLLSLVLIPLLITNPGNNGTNVTLPNETENNALGDEDFPELLGIKNFLDNNTNQFNDPLLAEVNDEIRRRHLEYPEDYFDHLEEKSEEVRKLIHSRQEEYRHGDRRHGRSEDGTEMDQSTSQPNLDSTTVPISIPTTSETPTSTSKKQGLISSAVTNIKKEADSLIAKIPNPLSAGRKLSGGKTTTPTPVTIPTAPETIETVDPTTNIDLNCSATEVQYKGGCSNLLQSKLCGPTKWLVEHPTTMELKCVENRCYQKSNMAPFGNDCVRVGGSSECHPGMRTYIYRSGIVECDCKEGYLYHNMDGNCYEAYTQGPCSAGQHFIIPKNSGSPKCMPNPCIQDRSFCNAPRCPKQRNCVTLGSACEKDVNQGTYEIDPTTKTPHCDVFKLENIIGNVPTLSCARGSRRDILGNCRTPTNIDFS